MNPTAEAHSVGNRWAHARGGRLGLLLRLPGRVTRRLQAEYLNRVRTNKRALRRYLPPAPVIVEAGAHIGTDTVDLAALWPRGWVHAFEPVPDLFRQLQAKTARRSNVTCYPLALAATDGTAQLHLSSGASNGSSSLLLPTGHLVDHPDVTFDKDIVVPTINLDTWMAADPRRRPDFLWLDLQGAEHAVLASSPKVLAAASAVYCEVSLYEAYAGGALYSTLRKFMEDAGFQVMREELYWSDGGNVLFVRQSGASSKPRRE